LNYKVKILSF